jgi:hypothetical protein
MVFYTQRTISGAHEFDNFAFTPWMVEIITLFDPSVIDVQGLWSIEAVFLPASLFLHTGQSLLASGSQTRRQHENVLLSARVFGLGKKNNQGHDSFAVRERMLSNFEGKLRPSEVHMCSSTKSISFCSR